KVQPGDECDRRAVERFAEQISDELNLKKVTLHDDSRGALLRPALQLNMKTVASKYGRFLSDVQAGLAPVDATAAAAKIAAGEMLQLDIPGHSDVTLEPGDVVINWKGADGWAGLMDRGTQVAIDTRITQDLAQEGMAREIVRHVQELRKKSGLEME